jgi:hypothetical protein
MAEYPHRIHGMPLQGFGSIIGANALIPFSELNRYVCIAIRI